MSKSFRTSLILVSIVLLLLGLALIIWPAAAQRVVCYVAGALCAALGVGRIAAQWRLSRDWGFQLSYLLGVLITLLGVLLIVLEGRARVKAGKGFFAKPGRFFEENYDNQIVDDTDIFVGDSVMFGPNVTLATAGHPIDPDLRKKVAQFNIPIHIGNNVWIGAGAVILPGIHIGDNSVIGAGSVVTKDIPANVVAVGNPCRILRKITERDKIFYYKDRKIELPEE